MYAHVVVSEESAEGFLAWCVDRLGLGFHPDTPFADYVDANGERCFDSVTAQQLDEQLQRAFAFCDPYEVGMS
jgi:hypothetical protein